MSARASIALRACVMLAVAMPLFAATAFRTPWWQILIAATIGAALGHLAVRVTRGHRVAAAAVAVVALAIAAIAAGWLLTRAAGPRVDPPAALAVRSTGKGSLTWDDVRAIQTALSPAAPYLHKSAQLGSREMNWMTQVVGTTPDYFAVRGLSLAAGRRFEAAESDKVVVLGDTVVAQLFGAHASPIGEQLRINRTPFTIIGVLAHQGMSPGGQDLDDVALVPIDIYTARLGFDSKVRFGGAVFLPLVHEEELRDLLRVRHHLSPGDDDDFAIAGGSR